MRKSFIILNDIVFFFNLDNVFLQNYIDYTKIVYNVNCEETTQLKKGNFIIQHLVS